MTPHSVSSEDAVALALHLRLSNEQMKKLRRWTKQWNVYLASERQTRKAIQEMRGSVDVGAEMVQTISERDGENVLVPAAFSWVTNLYVLIIQQ